MDADVLVQYKDILRDGTRNSNALLEAIKDLKV
jgi:hypothetical protein